MGYVIKAVETPMGRVEYCVGVSKERVDGVSGHLRLIGVMGDVNYSVRVPLGVVGIKTLPVTVYDELGIYVGHYDSTDDVELIALSVGEGTVAVTRCQRGPIHTIGDDTLHTFTWNGGAFTVRREGTKGTLSVIQIRH
jgi:hypothetical protein